MISTIGGTRIGRQSFGGGGIPSNPFFGRFIACIGDVSTHGGVISTSNQDGRLKVGGIQVAAEGANHICPIPFHGTTTITAVTIKSFVNGKKILTYGAQAGCGAIIIPSSRKVRVE